MAYFTISYTKIYEVKTTGEVVIEADSAEEARQIALDNTCDSEDSEFDNDCVLQDYKVNLVEEC